MASALSVLVQVAIAIILVVVLFAIGFFVYNAELLKALRSMGTNKREVPVFKGVLDLGLMPDGLAQVYDTTNPSAPNFLDLTPAYNQRPGAAFTYNFWLYTDYDTPGAPQPFNQALEANTNAPTIKAQDKGIDPSDYILVLRGDPMVKRYQSLCSKPGSEVTKLDVMVKSPLIKLENGWDNLTVEFNTVASPDAVNEASKDQCKVNTSSDWSVMNNHKISVYGLRSGINAAKYNRRWYMVTVVVKDTSPEDPLPLRNKARCIIYINGQKELDRYVDNELESSSGKPSIVKQNTGNLYVGPRLAIPPSTTSGTNTITGTPFSGNPSKNELGQKLAMADLTYYNYELDPVTIRKAFSAGFSKTVAPASADPEKQSQAYLSSLSMPGSKPELSYF